MAMAGTNMIEISLGLIAFSLSGAGILFESSSS